MKPLENTFVLEGLIQGPIPDSAETVKLLQQFVEDLAQHHLRLLLEFNGGQFSLLGDDQPHQCSDFQPSPVPACIKQALERLLVLLPLPERSQVFSTLRSREFQPGVEQQALYTISPHGEVQVHLRESPKEVLLLREVRSKVRKRRLMLFGLGLLGVVLAGLLIDFKKVSLRFGNTFTEQKRGEISTDSKAMANALSATASITKDSMLEIQLQRGPDWSSLWQSSPSATADDWKRHLAAVTLHRGYAMVLLKDAEGNLLRAEPVDLHTLQSKEVTKVSLPLTPGEVVDHIEISP